MVLGTQIILKWELSKSMTRPKSNNKKSMNNTMVLLYQDGIISSLVSRMIPIADNLNVIELKAEQIIQGIT
jgi:hypothetical protein